MSILILYKITAMPQETGEKEVTIKPALDNIREAFIDLFHAGYCSLNLLMLPRQIRESESPAAKSFLISREMTLTAGMDVAYGRDYTPEDYERLVNSFDTAFDTLVHVLRVEYEYSGRYGKSDKTAGKMLDLLLRFKEGKPFRDSNEVRKLFGDIFGILSLTQHLDVVHDHDISSLWLNFGEIIPGRLVFCDETWHGAHVVVEYRGRNIGEYKIQYPALQAIGKLICGVKPE